jgi:pimeloyl-ACP methyl ester carboxylesterase
VPRATTDGVGLHYQTDGTGETVVFVGDVGYGAWLWSVQYPAIAGPRQALVWDLRGTGESDAPSGPYDVDVLASDLEAVLADAGVDRAHLVGAGLGGMVALRYARTYGRARSLVLLATAASGEAVDEDALAALHPPNRDAASLRASLDAAFTDAFLAEQSAFVDQVVDWRQAEDAGPDAVTAQSAAMRDFEAAPLHVVTRPTLVCSGTDDPVIPRAAGEALAADLPRGEFAAIAGRHLAFVESGTAVNDRLESFFERVEVDD